MDALRRAGMRPISLASVGDGCPDILAGFRGLCIVLEVKDGARALTIAERDFALTWPGPYAVVTSPEEAINAVLAHAKFWGAMGPSMADWG